MITMTASSLRAILCYIDPTQTAKIAYDDDRYAELLITKVKNALFDKDGSQSVTIHFKDNETELKRQFRGVCGNIREVFDNIIFCIGE